jgi:hypothetical protein
MALGALDTQQLRDLAIQRSEILSVAIEASLPKDDAHPTVRRKHFDVIGFATATILLLIAAMAVSLTFASTVQQSIL